MKFAPKLTEQGDYCLTFLEHMLGVRLCWELSSQQSREMERLWERRCCAQDCTAKLEPGLNPIFHLFPKLLSLLLTHKTCPWIPFWQTSVDSYFGAISEDLLSIDIGPILCGLMRVFHCMCQVCLNMLYVYI